MSQSPLYNLHRNDGEVELHSGERRLRLRFVTPSIVRVTCTEGRDFSATPSLIVTTQQRFRGFVLYQSPHTVTLATEQLRIAIDRRTGALTYADSQGRLLFREPARGGKWLSRKPVYRNVFPPPDPDRIYGQSSVVSIDGARVDAEAEPEAIFARDAFEARLDFVFSDDEALFGLGSHEEGYGNLRGCSRDLYQQNMKAVVPWLVSTRGYAVLLDCGSLMTFHDDALGSYWWADAVDELDFYVVAGPSFDAVSEGMRVLTGPTPLPPRWLFGFVQSKERYVNADELLDVVREYRRRNVPLDCIVLDWKSWPNGEGWGQKAFDPQRFPDPSALTARLHQLGVRLMISIWPIMTGGCADQRELLDADLMLGNRATYDAFSPAARALYWEQANRGLFTYGIDAWWCDCTEPFEADWAGAVKPEPHLRLALNTAQAKRFLDAAQVNTYSLLHSRGVYEGQRGASAAKRVVNLTRSSYAGQHRYGTITWNGDVSATWQTLARCIPEGVNFCATGEAYWTTDIGGFFLAHHPELWFWRGDFDAGTRGLTAADALQPDPLDTGSTDLGFWELYTRWLQYAVFLPVFRSHGTDAPREIWRFGEPGTRFYDAIAASIRLRYRLVPYLYSLAAQVTLHGHAMLRAVALQFPQDARTHDLVDQFLLGPSLLVCPVTHPMYFTAGSQPLRAPETRPVYLPAGSTWIDFWTGARHSGGQTIVADAPLERMPLFVAAGSILPFAQPMQFVDQHPDAPCDLHVYTGADGEFTLYEDAGDGYAYEAGAYALVRIAWSEQDRTLTLFDREGSFAQLVRTSEFHVTLGDAASTRTRSIRYSGERLDIDFNEAEQKGHS